MKHLIYPVNWTIDNNWPQSGNKYKYNCIDQATLDLINSQKEVYLIWWWYNRRHNNFYDVVKGTFYRGDYGVVTFIGEILKSSRNYKKFVKSHGYDSVYGDNWLPAVHLGEFHELIGIEMDEHNKLTALVIDNEQEALDLLNRWYDFLDNKYKESTKEHNKFYQDQIDELEKQVKQNAEEFKNGSLTYEEFHSMQYQLFKKIEELKKELI